jgi:hypothetical protein
MASPYLLQATDGTDLGANIATVVALTNVAVSGDRRTITEVRYGGASQFMAYTGVNRVQYPRTLLDTDTFPTRAGMTVHNISGDAALRTLLGNGSLTTGPHIVVLDHTVTYSGDYFGAFPVRNGDVAPGGNNVVVFISKAIYDSMPGGSWVSTVCPPKVRVTSNDLANLAFFQGSSTLGSFMVSGATKGWRFIGLRFGLSTSAGSVSHLVSIGNGDTSVQRNNTMCPSNVGLDRCWFDAHASADTRHTCELHCANGYVIDCGWGQNIFVINYAESHGICGYNGPGPFRIINNGVVGGSQSIFFGGGASPCGMPSDIEIRFNYCTRPASWFGSGRMVKCGFEIKKAAYLLFEGNIVENVWPQSQVGYGCLLKSESYGDASVVGTTHDVLVRANIVRNVAGAVNIAGVPNVDPAIAPVRVVSFGNLYLVGGGIYNASGNPFCGAYLSTDCGSIHDTMVSVGTVNQVAAPGNATRYLLLDSIYGPTTYGVKGSSMAEGTVSMTNGMPGSLTAVPPTVAKSVFTARPSGSYPASCYFPANEAAIQYTNAAAKDYSLLGTTQSGGSTPGVPPLPAAPYAASLRIRTQPAGATSGSPLLTQPVLEILDQYGNIFNSTLTITATSDSGSVSDTGNTKAAVAGVATFTALTPTAGATVATTWTFTGTGLTSVTSDSVSVVVPVASPVATALRVKTQPSGAVSSVPLTTQPEVEVIDQYDNPITSTAVITAAVVSTGPVTFTAGTVKAAVAGVASFTNLTANTTAQFHASALFTSPGLTSVQSNAFSVAVFVQPPPPPVPVPDPDPPPQDPDPEPPTPPTTEPDPVPAQLVVTRAPGPATHIYSGKVWPIQPVLEARDINGDLMTSFSGAVTVSIQSGTGTLKGTTVAYAIGGVIRFTNLALKGAPGASLVLAFTDGPTPGQDV